MVIIKKNISSFMILSNGTKRTRISYHYAKVSYKHENTMLRKCDNVYCKYNNIGDQTTNVLTNGSYFESSESNILTNTIEISKNIVLRKHKSSWVKVFRINYEFRILRLTFHRKSTSKSRIKRY